MEFIGNQVLCANVEMLLEEHFDFKRGKENKKRVIIFDIQDPDTYLEIVYAVNTLKLKLDKKNDILVGVIFDYNKEFIKQIPPNSKEFEIPYYTVCLDKSKPINISKILN